MLTKGNDAAAADDTVSSGEDPGLNNDLDHDDFNYDGFECDAFEFDDSGFEDFEGDEGLLH